MSLRNENNQSDQTEFLDQAQFLENSSSKFFHLEDLKKNKSLRPFYILSLLIVCLLAVVLFNIFSKQQIADEVKNTEIEEDLSLDPLNQRVYELREDLKTHDPTKQSLPFPQVDLKFNIE